MELEFKIYKKKSFKVTNAVRWFELLFPNSTITESQTNDGEYTILKLFDPTISKDATEYYYDNISFEHLLETFPTTPGMKNSFFHMDSRTVWTSQIDVIENNSTVASIEVESKDEEDDVGDKKGQRNDEIDVFIENICNNLNLKMSKIADFRTITTTTKDNVQLTTNDLRRMIANYLVDSSKPTLAKVNTFNVDGFRSPQNRKELTPFYNYVTPTLEIVDTISSKIK